MTRTAPLPADVAKTDKANTWTGTQDFSGATVLGISGGTGGTTSGATSTAPGLVQLAGDLAGTYTAPTVPGLATLATGKADKSSLATVATSGSYPDLINRPALATVATSGAYTDLTGRPALAPVATSGSYGDLTSRPLLAPVATSGSYTDLTGKPTIPTALYAVLTADGGSVGSGSDGVVVTVPNVPPGTYALDGFTLASLVCNAIMLKGTNTGDVTGSAMVLGASTSAGTGDAVVVATAASHTTVTSAVGFRWGGVLTVTTQTAISLLHSASASWTPKAGSYMTLTKVA